MDRRAFLKIGILSAGVALSGCSRSETDPVGPNTKLPYGGLREDPSGVIDLPRGFRYRVLLEEGDSLGSGPPNPGRPDGMTTFPAPGNSTLLIRNHELHLEQGPPVESTNPFDSGGLGGTTALVVGPDRTLLDSYVTSSGTERNCAGGRTPWGTWLTCEETRSDGHGFVFEILPEEAESDLSKLPIRGMGFFSHEAIGVDPRSGILYLTEDDKRGSSEVEDSEESQSASFLYRYLPDDRSGKPGALHRGGMLQALTLEDSGEETDKAGALNNALDVRWVTVDPEDAHEDAVVAGAARFNRLEGAVFCNGVLWFDDTEGGPDRLGQVYRYTPATEKLELWLESTDEIDFKNPDNVTIAPWGDLWFVEDGDEGNRIMGVSPSGEVYLFAFTRLAGAEFTGPCFSPDGTTLFVNIQVPAVTLAVWGPFGQRSASRGPNVAASSPPRELKVADFFGTSAAKGKRLAVGDLQPG